MRGNQEVDKVGHSPVQSGQLSHKKGSDMSRDIVERQLWLWGESWGDVSEELQGVEEEKREQEDVRWYPHAHV